MLVANAERSSDSPSAEEAVVPEEEAVSEEVGSGEEATSPLRVPPVVQQQQAITAAMAERQQRTYDRIKATADVTADYTKGIDRKSVV